MGKDTNDRTDLAGARALLSRLGYRVASSGEGITQCLLVRGAERWLGVGTDADEAFEDALRKAFPSLASRVLLRAALSGARAAERPHDATSDATGTPNSDSGASSDRGEQSTEPAAFGGHEVPREPEPLPEAPSPVPSDAQKGEPPPPELPHAPEPAPQTDSVASRSIAEISSANRKGQDLPAFTPADALASLKDLQSEITADRAELALAAPDRQRLVMLGWVCRARSYVEAHPAESEINYAVRDIVRLVSSLAKAWWPGSVNALRLDCRPADVLLDLPFRIEPAPASWAEAQDLVERVLHEIEAKADVSGRDEYGWADAAYLLPTPRDPDAILGEVCAQVERLGGPLGILPMGDAQPEAARLLEWTRKLRWCRGAVLDAERWGRLAGRLRFWARKYRSEFAEAARTLEPDYTPPKSWASLLGIDPDKARRRQEVKEVFGNAPHPREAPDDARLMAWLVRALKLSDTHWNNVVEATKPFADRIAAIDPAKLPDADRRVRRRLALLQPVLRGEASSTTPPIECESAVDEPDLGALESADDSAEIAGPAAILRALVAPHTRGRRAVFISNRSDPELRERLCEHFQFDALDWKVCEPRRERALQDAIAAGSYEFVLGATGFLSHSTDAVLARACRKSGARYVRVYRGRPLACLRAVARELGIPHST